MKSKSPALADCPQRRGVCVQVMTRTPKAELGAAEGGKGALDQRVRVIAYIRVKVTNLQEHSIVMVRASSKDLPGSGIILFGERWTALEWMASPQPVEVWREASEIRAEAAAAKGKARRSKIWR